MRRSVAPCQYVQQLMLDVIRRFSKVVFFYHWFSLSFSYSWLSCWLNWFIIVAVSFWNLFARAITNFIQCLRRVSVSDSSRSFLMYAQGSISQSSTSCSVRAMLGMTTTSNKAPRFCLMKSPYFGNPAASPRQWIIANISLSHSLSALSLLSETYCQIFSKKESACCSKYSANLNWQV